MTVWIKVINVFFIIVDTVLYCIIFFSLGVSKKKSKKKRESNSDKFLSLPPCPKCFKHIASAKAREHLVSHLNQHFRIYHKDGACTICLTYTGPETRVARHAGLTHDKFLDFASDEQIDWLRELGLMKKYDKKAKA